VPPPERAATLAELRAVRASLDELNQVMSRQVTEQVDAKVAEVAVPREEFTQRIRASGKRTVGGLLTLLLIAVLGIALNRATLLQAQRASARDLRTLIEVCRVTAPRINPGDLEYCEDRIPGFAEARRRAAEAAAATTRNQQRLRTLEVEVAELRKRR
jgi:hypothetical protein